MLICQQLFVDKINLIKYDRLTNEKIQRNMEGYAMKYRLFGENLQTLRKARGMKQQ